jgi:hypothetical protein
VVSPPLTRRKIVAAPELTDVQVFRSAQGTNFRLEPGVVAAIEALIALATGALSNGRRRIRSRTRHGWRREGAQAEFTSRTHRRAPGTFAGGSVRLRLDRR